MTHTAGNRARERGARSRGFTLIELLVVGSIMAVLTAMAFWAMTTAIPAYRMTTATADASNTIALTRARAIARNRHYIVEFQSDRVRVIWDQDRDGSIDAGDVVESTVILPPGVRYQNPGGGTGLPGDLVAFDGRGMAYNLDMAGHLLQFATGSQFRNLRATFTGTVRKE